MSRNWKLNIAQSVRLCKFWFELIGLTDDELSWGFYTVTQEALSNLGARYALLELCHIPPPYLRTRHNLETITKSFNDYLSKGSFEEALGRWLRAPVTPDNPLDPPGAGLHREVEALLNEIQEEGIIAALWERNRQIINLIDYQDRKQSLGEDVVVAHEVFHSILDRALSAHDTVIREEQNEGVRTLGGEESHAIPGNVVRPGKKLLWD